MLPKELWQYNIDELENWLKYEAGVNNGQWFDAKEGGLELQQIPKEYSKFLDYIRSRKYDRYLNVGIGNGGSFITEIFMQPSLTLATAVDNLSYGVSNPTAVNERFEWIRTIVNHPVRFYNMTSDEFFKDNIEMYDFIFIDGDHSYEGVSKDYKNALKCLSTGGEIAFHDIASEQCPGVVQLWNEIKNDNCVEFIHSNKCGIGIWKHP